MIGAITADAGMLPSEVTPDRSMYCEVALEFAFIGSRAVLLSTPSINDRGCTLAFRSDLTRGLLREQSDGGISGGGGILGGGGGGGGYGGGTAKDSAVYEKWVQILNEDGSGGCAGGVGPSGAAKKKGPRLESLDVARGLTIAMMIFVDNVGDSWSYVDHTAWNGIRLADFVMPSFDVIVGVAVAFSMKHGRLKSSSDKRSMVVAALQRAAKLFVLGVFTQSGTPFPTLDLKR